MIKTLESITWDFEEADLFLDIGGNVGYWTIELFGLYDQIYFIEPSSLALAKAKQNIDTHCDFYKVPEQKNKVTYFKNICSNVKGESKSISSTTEDTGNFSIYAKGLYGENNINLAEDNIETITIDTDIMPLVKEDAKVLIKIDTEGCDLDVLLGGLEFIKRHRPLVMVEFHWHMNYDQEKRNLIFEFFKSLGYSFRTYIFDCYIQDPHKIWDGMHTGEQMRDLHFQVGLFPPR